MNFILFGLTVCFIIMNTLMFIKSGDFINLLAAGCCSATALLLLVYCVRSE